MVINGTMFDCDLMDVLSDLADELHGNGIELLGRMSDGPKNVQVQCPYHSGGKERRPSAGIKKDTGVFHCFQCGETHSLPEVISYCLGRTDDVMGSVGWQWLIRHYLSVSVEERRGIELDMGRDTEPEMREYVSEAELDKYRYYHWYWSKRGITDDGLIELFDLGYDSETDCITFPVRDASGNCLFVARRSVRSKYFNYPASAEKPLYGYYEMTTLGEFPKEVWVTESMIDALRLWQSGKPAIALNGLGSERQYRMMSSMPCRSFVLATDNDDAGMSARRRIKEKVSGHLMYEAEIPPHRKDIGECSDDEIAGIRTSL